MKLPHIRNHLAAILLVLTCCLIADCAVGQGADTDTQPAKAGIKSTTAAGDQLAEESKDTDTSNPESTNETRVQLKKGNGVTREALVVIGHDAELKKGETAEAVVV